ncbi:MAG: DUF5615 family PIN-like protein [Nitriliruptorales bacterium]
MLSPGLVAELPVGWDSDSVIDEGLAGSDDASVLRACQQQNRTLVTLDKDVARSDELPHNHPGVILLRPRSQALPHIRALLLDTLDQLATADIRGHVVVAELGRIRGLRDRG